MKVFKFGGASLKNAQAIHNMVKIIKQYQQEELVVIVSAMGKSTNALEGLIALAISGKSYDNQLTEFKAYQLSIIHELGLDKSKRILDAIEAYFEQIIITLETSHKEEYSKFYDFVVSFGELLSSTIVNYCLNNENIKSQWLDARELIKTDETFQDGKVNWALTNKNIDEAISKSEPSIFVSQGFIGSTTTNATTTLGREGSDYTAAIFASCLEVENVTIWKDVPGILNADPKIIDDAILFKELPYNEASEMTYYGAKVIHPKTIKPLANKKIPLHVRCFETPDKEGTIIHDCELNTMPPVIIYKENQCLVSFRAIDLAFVNEKGLSVIFNALHELDMNIRIMQNSAISFSACMDYNPQKLEKLIDKLKNDFSILYNTNLQLVTIKNYNNASLEKYKPKGINLLEQISRNNYRVLVQTD